MKPPPFGSGNYDWLVHAMRESVLLQWGHRLSAVETRRLAQAPSPYGPRFNGATAFRQWKPYYPDGCICSRIRASMGPPPFGSGNQPYLAVTDQAPRASMGPPPFGSGNSPLYGITYWPPRMLQWGHRLSAVETRFLGLFVPQGFDSFNGATAFRQWKPLFVL